MYYKTNYNSPIGQLTIAAHNNSLIGVWLEGQKYFQGSIKTELDFNDNIEVFQRTKAWLDRYFRGEKPEISELSLAPIGNDFRQNVWKILCEIPYGEVITYGDIAKQIAKKRGLLHMSAQAIGGAVGHNPISIIIPCHRVVGANGNLTGYAGGLNTKIKLLEHEKVDISRFFIPA